MNLTERISRKTVVPLLFLALTASYCTFPLLLRQNLPYAQDIIFHVFQADQFNLAIHDGIIYPRWVAGSNNGYGSANFIFYSPLSYYFVSFITLLVPSLIAAMVVALWCGFFLSGVAMFVAVRRLFGERGGVLSGVIYQFLPFHLMDLYMRGGFAEIFAFIWFPLIFLYLYETLHAINPKRGFAGLSISYAGLILTHLASAFIFTFAIAGYMVFHCFFADRSRLPKALLSLALGLGVSAVYLGPAVIERAYVQIEQLTMYKIGNYRDNFLFTPEKFSGGLADFYLPLHTGLVLEILLFLVIVAIMHKHRKRSFRSSREDFFVFLFLAALFLTTPLSMPLWAVVPGLPTLQFPWRWVSVIEISLCFLIGNVFAKGEPTAMGYPRLKRIAQSLIIVLLLASAVLILKSKTLPQRFVEKYLISGKVTVLIDPVMEYTPVWARNVDRLLSEKNEAVSVIAGSAVVRVLSWKSQSRILGITAHSPATLRLSTFYYPGWKASIDGRRSQIRIESKSGAMLLDVPQGEHTVDLKFTDIPIRSFSRSVSLISLFAVIFLPITFQRKKDRTLPKG
jgi:hypothetical protein